MRSYFDGGLLQLIGYRMIGFLVTVLTLGIYALWLGRLSLHPPLGLIHMY